jgi:xanthine dehydrogenase YagS FAD-binding subunit
VALDAQVQIAGTQGQRTLPIEQLHRLPGDTPHLETMLEPGDLITEVLIPASGYAKRSHYVKVRDRASFEFALSRRRSRSTPMAT